MPILMHQSSPLNFPFLEEWRRSSPNEGTTYPYFTLFLKGQLKMLIPILAEQWYRNINFFFSNLVSILTYFKVHDRDAFVYYDIHVYSLLYTCTLVD